MNAEREVYSEVEDSIPKCMTTYMSLWLPIWDSGSGPDISKLPIQFQLVYVPNFTCRLLRTGTDDSFHRELIYTRA